jgi:uncharacterized protein YrrD
MLYRAKELNNFELIATDGEIGKAREFYFDDRYWTIRYLVAETGNWLTGRQTLISPYALVDVHAEQEKIHTRLTKKQIEEGPSLETDKPVSRQFEETYHMYFGWPGYWYGPYVWGPYYYPWYQPRKQPEAGGERWDPNLRSSREVAGYHIHAKDGEIGHIEDFIIDDETWTIRYLVVDTRNWWPGKEILISPEWIEKVSWSEQQVFTNLNRETIKQAPEYDSKTVITRDYERRVHSYYNREGYWVREPLKTA